MKTILVQQQEGEWVKKTRNLQNSAILTPYQI